MLSLAGVLLVLLGGLFASYRVQQVGLKNGSLNANYAYATKLSLTISEFLISVRQQLEYSSQVLGRNFENTAVLQNEANRLKHQTNSFNSVAIIDKTGLVLATDPDIGLTGAMVSSPGVLQALNERVPLISEPYVSTTGRLLIIISQPIFDTNQQYLGFVSGTIYLNEPSILNSLLGVHFYQDGSYLYIVDRKRVLLHHPDESRVGTVVAANPLVDEIARGSPNGMMELVNSLGVPMLAGYSMIPDTGWGVVSQQPTELALLPLDNLFKQVLKTTLPIAALTALFIWWFSRIISSPLRQLAESAKKMDEPDSTAVIQVTRAWYFETANLKKGLLTGIQLLQEKVLRLDAESRTDALTGLLNRRAFDATIHSLRDRGVPFSLVTIDIDHFKLVNDRYGHAVGDDVLKHLAALLIASFRTNDVVCRTGGEEFSVLVTDLQPIAVREVAERVRKNVETTTIEPVGSITVSLGIAHWPSQARSVKEVIALSDQMLYAAKRNGRNRVEMTDPDSFISSSSNAGDCAQ